MGRKSSAGLALLAGLGVALIASGGSGSSNAGPRPVPKPPKPSNPNQPGPDESVPPEILARVVAAVATKDPKVLRAEAAKLRAEGYIAQAESLEEYADELEAAEKGPPEVIPGGYVPPIEQGTLQRDLVRGMTGEDVRAWQNVLRADGYVNIVADADFGPLTFSATKEWQWERGLEDDGIVGPKTRAKIGTKPTRSRPKPGTTATPSTPAPPVKPPPVSPVPSPPVATKPPTTPTAPKPPAAPPSAPKPPAPTPVATTPPATSSPGVVPAKLVGVTLRKQPPPEPTDERVKLWQDQLKKLGHRGATTKSDGKFGPNTETQTKAFQKARKLSATGVADPITIATAYGAPLPAAPSAPAPKPAPATPTLPPLMVNIASWRSVMKKGSKGQDVREWQQVLGRYGFPVDVDGDFGTLTHDATVKWQTSYARFNDPTRKPLVPDGEVGKNSRDRLIELERPQQIVAGDLEHVSDHDVAAELPPSLLAPMDGPPPPEALASPLVQLAGELVAHLETTQPGNEDRALVQRFQLATGLDVTGTYGPTTAEALIPLGFVPPTPRYWPSKKLWRSQYRYRVALREQATRDPARATEWLSAATAF